MPISVATTKDIPELITLLNSAYRGHESRKGWTTEADLVEGELRTDHNNMIELMQLPGGVFLKYTHLTNEITGCVFLHKRDRKLYLGMLSVVPGLQTQGIGKQLMKAAELYAKQQTCDAIFMRVISARQELIAWYERQGYYSTGETEPFPDGIFGTSRIPIEFIILQKDLE